MSTITVRVQMEIEVDVEAWELEYGTTPRGLVNDVEDYLFTQITQSTAAEAGAFKPTAYAVHES